MIAKRDTEESANYKICSLVHLKLSPNSYDNKKNVEKVYGHPNVGS